MSEQVVLIVEKNDRIRAAICNAFKARFVPTFDVGDAFDAMSALGRANFGAAVLTPGKRQLSLRGFCTLARRRHPDLQLFVIVESGTSVEKVEQAIGVSGVKTVAPQTTVEALATQVCAAMQSINADFSSPDSSVAKALEAFEKPASKAHSANDASSAPTQKTPLTPGQQSALAQAGQALESSREPALQSFPAAHSLLKSPATASAQKDFSAEARAVTQKISPIVLPENVNLPSADEDLNAALLPVEAPAGAAQKTPQFTSTSAPVEEELKAIKEPRSFSVPLPITALEAFAPEAPPASSADDENTHEYTPATPTNAPPAWSTPAEDAISYPEESLKHETAPLPIDDIDAGISLPITEGFPLLEGVLHQKAGPALLLSLAAQELTGILTLQTGPVCGRIYFHQGEPVWATPENGDEGLFELLKSQQKIPSNADFPYLPDGQLVAHLAAAGYLEGKELYKFMLGFVRERLIGLIAETKSAYAFYDDATFTEVAPLLKVNPFGIVFECKRRELSPDLLLAIGSDIEWKYLHPLPALAPALERIKPFVREMDLGRFFNGTRTMHAFCEHTGLDTMIGTLMVLTLEEARLVSIKDNPRDLEKEGVQLTETTGVHKR